MSNSSKFSVYCIKKYFLWFSLVIEEPCNVEPLYVDNEPLQFDLSEIVYFTVGLTRTQALEKSYKFIKSKKAHHERTGK